MRVILFILISTMYFSTKAQKATVVYGNTNKIPNVSVRIYNTIYGTSADQNGNYALRINSLDSIVRIQYSSIGYRDTIIDVDLRTSINDSINLNIVLTSVYYDLAEVIISEDNEFLKLKGAKILDIEFISDAILVLSAQKGKKVIYSVRTDGEINQKLDLAEDYNELYIDCFNSIFLLSNKYALQITIDANDLSIYAINKYSIEDFNKMIKPCKANIGDYIVTSNFSRIKLKLKVDQYHNKKADYFYFLKDEGPKEREILASFFDEDAYKISSSYFQEIVGVYYNTTKPEDNLMELGTWDGNIWKLYNGQIELLKLITWYLQVESKEIELYTFTSKQELLFIDLSNYEMNIFNDQLELRDSFSFESQKESYEELETIIKDKKSQIIYGVVNYKSTYNFYPIELSSGKLIKENTSITLNLPIELAIHDGWLYYATYDTLEKSSILDRKKIR